MNRFVGALALAAALLAVGVARASGPIGGFLIIDKVVLAPPDAPTTIQIWGGIALAVRDGGKEYGTPRRGYLYYKIPPGGEALCRREWNDLKKAAGTGGVIGFGSNHEV